MRVLTVNAGTERIRALAEPIAAELGLEVLEVELLGKTPRQVLRIYLDSPSEGRPVTIGDCEAVSRRLGDALDAYEALAGRYMLEVSSPGIHRPLKKPEHFRRVLGGRVRLRLGTATDGMRNLVGRLIGFEGEHLTVEGDDGHRITVRLPDVEKANFEHEFPDTSRPGRRRR
jgi:ribosome maturation factor RimP